VREEISGASVRAKNAATTGRDQGAGVAAGVILLGTKLLAPGAPRARACAPAGAASAGDRRRFCRPSAAAIDAWRAARLSRLTSDIAAG